MKSCKLLPEIRPFLGFLFCLVLSSFAHAGEYDQLDLTCERYTALDATHYRDEAGSLSSQGFIPTTSANFTYGAAGGHFPTSGEVAPISGQPVIKVSLWVQLKNIEAQYGYSVLGHFQRSENSYNISGVPYYIVRYTGNGLGGTFDPGNSTTSPSGHVANDFNGDGKSDILLTNSSTGDRAMWLMNGTTIATNAFVSTVPLIWQISATGDFDGDGKADIFWTNTTTGDRSVWLMNGSTVVAGGYLGSVPVAWAVSSTGDYDGDGKADILWTNASTGERAIWLMNGVTTKEGASLGAIPVQWVTSK